MINKKYYTDYPITELGDEPYKLAPLREVIIRSYDGDKYCQVIIVQDMIEKEIKRGYIYNNNQSVITTDELAYLCQK